MRVILVILVSAALTGCTAMMVGGGASTGYQVGKDERATTVASTDAAITTEIKSKYVADSVVSAFNINVTTYNGTVTLSGAVDRIMARNRAVSLARQTNGVRAVNNRIVIEDRS